MATKYRNSFIKFLLFVTPFMIVLGVAGDTTGDTVKDAADPAVLRGGHGASGLIGGGTPMIATAVSPNITIATTGSLDIGSSTPGHGTFSVEPSTGDTSIDGILDVFDNAFFGSNLNVEGDLDVTGAQTIHGGTTYDGNVAVKGFLSVGDGASTTTPSDGKVWIDKTTGNTTIKGTLGVTELTTATGGISVPGTSTLTVGTGATTLGGLLNANGGIAVDTNAFTVADTTGNTATAGTLSAVGNFKVGATGSEKFEVTASDGTLAINTNKFNVNGTTGDVTAGPTGKVFTVNGTSGDVTAGLLANQFKVAGSDGTVTAGLSTAQFKVDGATGDTTVKGILTAGPTGKLFTVDGTTGDVSAGLAARQFKVYGTDDGLITAGTVTAGPTATQFKVAGDTGNTSVAGTFGVGSSYMEAVKVTEIGLGNMPTFNIEILEGCSFIKASVFNRNMVNAGLSYSEEFFVDVAGAITPLHITAFNNPGTLTTPTSLASFTMDRNGGADTDGYRVVIEVWGRVSSIT